MELGGRLTMGCTWFATVRVATRRTRVHGQPNPVNRKFRQLRDVERIGKGRPTRHDSPFAMRASNHHQPASRYSSPSAESVPELMRSAQLRV